MSRSVEELARENAELRVEVATRTAEAKHLHNTISLIVQGHYKSNGMLMDDYERLALFQDLNRRRQQVYTNGSAWPLPTLGLFAPLLKKTGTNRLQYQQQLLLARQLEEQRHMLTMTHENKMDFLEEQRQQLLHIQKVAKHPVPLSNTCTLNKPL